MDDKKREELKQMVKDAREKRALKWEKYWLHKLGNKVTPIGIALIGAIFGVFLSCLGNKGFYPEYALRTALWWAAISAAFYLYFEWQYRKYKKEKKNGD